MIAWRGGRQRVTNEPPELPALVMDGLEVGRRGGHGLGGGCAHQDKCFFLLELGQAQREEPARSLREAWAARCRKAETRGQGWGRREVQRQRPETWVPRDDGVGAGAGEKEQRRDWEPEREMEMET